MKKFLVVYGLFLVLIAFGLAVADITFDDPMPTTNSGVKSKIIRFKVDAEKQIIKVWYKWVDSGDTQVKKDSFVFEDVGSCDLGFINQTKVSCENAGGVWTWSNRPYNDIIKYTIVAGDVNKKLGKLIKDIVEARLATEKGWSGTQAD